MRRASETKDEQATMRRHAGAATAATIAGAVEGWQRERMLPRLIAIGPDELADVGRAGRLLVVRRLLGALRGERARGRAGHWSYSLDRHIGLVQALAAERAGLARVTVREAVGLGATRPRS